jgi:hypothetical protein
MDFLDICGQFDNLKLNEKSASDVRNITADVMCSAESRDGI